MITVTRRRFLFLSLAVFPPAPGRPKKRRLLPSESLYPSMSLYPRG
jgi:hypothetical protein